MKNRAAILILITLMVSAMYISASAASGIRIDKENFPNVNFRQYVSEHFDSDSNGYLSKEERNAVEKINCSYMEITSLRGIEYFTHLKTLNCSYNGLKRLSLKKNTRLEKLYCEYNELVSLNITKCNRLIKVDAYCNRIEKLNVRHNTRLKYLDLMNNRLSKIYVKNNSQLRKLVVTSNKIKTLDVRENEKLVTLFVEANKMKKLKLSNNPKLRTIRCTGNRLKTLDIRKCRSVNSVSLDKKTKFLRKGKWSKANNDPIPGTYTWTKSPSS